MADKNSVVLQINGLDTLKRNLNSISEDLVKYMEQAMYNACVIVRNDAKDVKAGSFKNQKGNLRRSIQIQTPVTATKGVIFTDQNYALGVERGTPAHIIVPTNKKALFWKGAAHPVKKVNHPGSKAYPFMEPALSNNIDKIFEQYEMMFDAIGRDFSA